MPLLLDEREVRRQIEKLVPIRRQRANTDPIAPYIEALGQVRLGLWDPEEVEAERDDIPGFAAAFGPYRTALRKAGAVDFDEQIYGAIEALLGDGAFRRRAQAGCRHLLVDEFQDLTPAHVLLLRLLAMPGLEVFGVGDDDQVIYGHAGADPGVPHRLRPAVPGRRRPPAGGQLPLSDGGGRAGRQAAVPQPQAGGQGHPARPGRVRRRADACQARRPPGRGRGRRSWSRRCGAGSTDGRPAGRHRRADQGQRPAAGAPGRPGRGRRAGGLRPAASSAGADRAAGRPGLPAHRHCGRRGASPAATSPRSCAGRAGACRSGFPTGSAAAPTGHWRRCAGWRRRCPTRRRPRSSGSPANWRCWSARPGHAGRRPVTCSR